MLTFPTRGIDDSPGAHAELSSAPLGIRRLILHWHAYGPILPLSSITGGTPDPDVGYSERHGQHHRRGLVIRFPPGSGVMMMAQWNSHRTAHVDWERASGPPRPQAVGLFGVTNGEDGTCQFYLMPYDLLATGGTYSQSDSPEE